MIRLKIDHIDMAVPEGTTVLQATRLAGIDIPSMCFSEGYSNHPSCMVCLVKDRKSGNLYPSCATEVVEGMEVVTGDEEVRLARKDALELLLSDHVGDCEAPCTLACPAGMNIPLMNRLIAGNDFAASLRVVKQEIALPFVLGYICPAPCEKACRRKQLDSPVSVCLLKRFVAADDIAGMRLYLPQKEEPGGKKVAIIGTGPAGLAAAYYLLQKGHSCVLYDENEMAGGALRHSIPEEELPRSVLDAEIRILADLGAEFRLGVLVTEELFISGIKPGYDAVILATGDVSVDGHLLSLFQGNQTGIAVTEGTYEASEQGVFACGSIIRPQWMAVRAVAQGKAAALSADRYLRGLKPVKARRRFNSRFDRLRETEFAEYLKESVPGNRIEPSGGPMAGLTAEEAVMEASRCLHCDCRKAEDCRLREYADQYAADRKKYATGDRNSIVKFHEHDRVIYEPEKCIRCGLCIDIAVRKGEITGLAFSGKGFDVRMTVPFGYSLGAGLTHSAGECVESCPTGALAFRTDPPIPEP